MNRLMTIRRVLTVAMAIGILMGTGTRAQACPFCSAESKTLTEETQTSDAVVLAKLVKEAAPPDENNLGDDLSGITDDGMATFRVVDVLQGQDLVAKEQEIEVVFFGEPDREQVFLISGIGTDLVDWTTPLPLSTAAVDYVRKLANVPASGVERLAFFQEYLENDDPLLAQDAYDEFARAPYAEVIALKPRMNRDRLVAWINDPENSPSRRRLYLTMLGVCGTASDLPMLETLIKSDFRAMKPHFEQLVQTGLALGGPIGLPAWIDIVDQDERRKKLGLDALVACYLTLRGPVGLDLVDERFLKNQNTEYTYIYSTIMALRFHGEEPSSTLPRERLLASVRLLLDNPEFADQVIPDLARWEDWSVLDRLVNMFKTSDKNGYVRQPVVTYLTVASEQPGDLGTKAQTALTELEQLDPEGVKQARSLMAFGALSRARSNGGSTTSPSESKPVDSPASTADASDEFAATAAEIQSGEDAKPGDFADPANYGDRSPSPTTESSSAKSDDSAGAAKAPVQETTSSSSPTAASATQAASPTVTAAATSVPVTSDGTARAESEPSSVLIVGVPLVAAVLLMGIYWVILRTGAV